MEMFRQKFYDGDVSFAIVSFFAGFDGERTIGIFYNFVFETAGFDGDMINHMSIIT